jgi:hypothetical protein
MKLNFPYYRSSKKFSHPSKNFNHSFTNSTIRPKGFDIFGIEFQYTPTSQQTK